MRSISLHVLYRNEVSKHCFLCNYSMRTAAQHPDSIFAATPAKHPEQSELYSSRSVPECVNGQRCNPQKLFQCMLSPKGCVNIVAWSSLLCKWSTVPLNINEVCAAVLTARLRQSISATDKMSCLQNTYGSDTLEASRIVAKQHSLRVLYPHLTTETASSHQPRHCTRSSRMLLPACCKLLSSRE